MQAWDFTLTALYAELIERVRADGDMPSAGRIVVKSIKGGRYCYQRLSFMGKAMQFYLGRCEDDDRQRMHARLADRARLTGMLLQAGANGPSREAAATIELLDAIGVFRKQGAVLIGSHAFSVIGNMLGVSWRAGLMQTMDVDIGRGVHVAGQPIRVGEALARAGFREVPALDHRHPATSFMLDRARIKIDFLAPLHHAPDGAPVRLSGMGVHADRLRFLDYLIDQSVQSVALTRYGVLLRIPLPARFAFHKILVAARRPVVDHLKRKKDMMQAAAVMALLGESAPDELIRAWEDLPWKKQAKKGLAMLDGKTRAMLEELGVSIRG